MNTQERIVVGLLFAALIAWMVFQPRKTVEPPPPSSYPAQTNAAPAVVAPAPVVATETNAQEAIVELQPAEPEQRIGITNAELSVTVSSWGASVRDVKLLQFDEERGQPDPVDFDFDSCPALSFAGVPGIGTNSSFLVARGEDGSVILTGTTTSGVTVTRTITAMPGYRLDIMDSFSNSTERAVTMPDYGLRMGPMYADSTQAAMAGIPTLGIDTFSSNAKASTIHWSDNLAAIFNLEKPALSCSGPNASGAPRTGTYRVDTPLAWAAVKTKFFVQILAPEGGCLSADLSATRDMENESVFSVQDISATLWFPGQELAPGQGLDRTSSYYIGPKKYTLLRTFPNRQADVMEFGMWHWLCKPLLFILIGIHKIIPNYGIAIILLTVLVRVLFWPLTHKSTESMKKMQELAPLINELKERYKSDPQKMQQETMLLYRAHGVNPLSGCLPMLIQIPVFFALYVVLRSAVELRYAGFLWIGDLSRPEGLFADILPIPLNILPFLMTATMVLQQKMTPSTADQSQQKIMMVFSIAMMFMFYSLPSALLLYWTVSQSLSIVQLHMQHKAAEKKAAAKAAGK